MVKDFLIHIRTMQGRDYNPCFTGKETGLGGFFFVVVFVFCFLKGGCSSGV
jgi:hypothetical protein